MKARGDMSGKRLFPLTILSAFILKAWASLCVFNPLFAGAQEIQSICPAMMEDYVTPSNTVLAKYKKSSVTDTDLLLFLTVSKDRDPNIFPRYLKEQNPRQKTLLREKIQEAIRSYAFVGELAEQASPSREPAELSSLRIRLASYPAYELVWVEDVLYKKLKITDQDIIAYYQRNQEDYERPASVKLRLMYIPASQVLPELERQKIRMKIDDLYKRAMEGEDFEYLVEKYSALFPGTARNGILEVLKSDTYNRFYEEARATKIKEFSPVFQREDGFFFLQCLDKTDPQPIPLSDVRSDIVSALKTRSIRYLYSFEWNQLSRKYHPGFHWYPWEEMKDNFPMIRVQNLTVTKGDFWRLFPDIIGENFTLKEPLIRDKVKEIHQFECIRLEIEQTKLQAHPFITIGTLLARDSVQSRLYLEDLFSPLKKVSDKDLLDYYENNPEKYTVNAWKGVKQIVGEVIQPVQYSPEALEDVLVQMENNLIVLVTEAGEIVDQGKNKGEDQGTQSPVFPSSFLEDLVRTYSTDLFKFQVRDLGKIHLEEASDIWPVLRPLSPGEFSPVMKTQHFVYCYYIEEVYAGDRTPFESVKTQIRSNLVQSRMEEAAKELKERTLADLGLTFEQVLHEK